MFVSIASGGSYGIRSYLSQVEVDTSQALPGFDMVGYLGSEVKDVTMVRLIQSIIKKSA